MLTIVRFFQHRISQVLLLDYQTLLRLIMEILLKCDQSTVFDQETPYFFTRVLVETSDRSVVNWNES